MAKSIQLSKNLEWEKPRLKKKKQKLRFSKLV